VNITLAIHEQVGRHWQRLMAITTRGLSQALGVIPPLLVLHAYGAGGFGLFSMLIAVSGLSILFEWGLPQKVQNEVSRGNAGHRYDMRWLLGKGALPLHLGVNLVLAWSLWAVSSHWLGSIFPAPMVEALSHQRYALLGIFLIAAATGATYQARSVTFGLGHIDRGFAFTLAGTAVMVALVVFASKAGAPIEMVALLAAAAPLLERLIGIAYCFVRREPLARHPDMPQPLAAEPEKPSRTVACMFFYLQVLALLASNLDTLYAGRANSLQAVGEYAFLLKLFGIPLLIVSIFNTSMLPRLAVEAHGAGDRGRHTLESLVRSNVVIMVALGGCIVLIAGALYQMMSGAQANLRLLSLLLLLDMTVLAIRGVLTTFVNAAEVIGLNIVGNTIFAVGAIALKIFFVDAWGVSGLVIANTLAYLLLLLPFHLAAVMKVQRR
jgi:O-antigen/teichoic acid export membrane protein